MTFRDIKQGDIIYLLNKKDMTITEGSVASASAPHIEPYGNIQTTAQMIVDITANIANSQKTFAIPDSLATTYAGDLVICADKDAVIRELKSLQGQSKECVDNYEYHKERYTKCASLLVELSPELKERQQTEERFARLEDSLGRISEMLNKLIN